MLKKDQVRLGIAPIGWTNDDLPELGGEISFEQCISEMSEAGFVGCEVGNKYPKDPKVLKPALDQKGLQIANQWFSSLLTSEGYEVTIENFKKQLEFLKAMGATVIGASEQGNSIQGKPVPILSDQKPVFTEEQWELIAKGCNDMGKIAKDEGITFTYHHHMGTGIQFMDEVDRFLDMTDPELVFLLYDTGHFAFCGEDPLAAVKRYVDRIGHVHLKDVRPEVLKKVKEEDMSFLDAVKAGAFTVPGDGSIDFKPIFDVLAENNYHGWMIVEAEQDPAKANPLEYAKKARQYIKENTGL
ncbi:MAG TPA: myo-inosose-2 dehydratase [Fastidiosipila sp.]|nr:myo-inosose-2 dehydratase [Fastidiosipila sp.]